MNKEALNHAYNLFKNDGYDGSVDEFSSLMSTNDDAVNYAYSLFKNDGYTKDINDFKDLVKSEDGFLELQKENKLKYNISNDKNGILDFLVSDKPEVTQEKMTNFFDKTEENAIKEMEAIFGKDENSPYEYEESNDFKNFNKVIIKHKASGKEIELDFGIGKLMAADATLQSMYKSSNNKLFNFVNETLSKEDILKTQEAQTQLVREVESLEQEGGPLHISTIEAGEINDKYQTEDLFTPITKQVNISRDPKFPQMVNRTEEPYKEELERSKQILINQGNENPTQEEIESLTRQNLYNEEYQELYDQKMSNYMNSDEVEETDLASKIKMGSQIKDSRDRKELLTYELNFNSKLNRIENLPEVKRTKDILNVLNDPNQNFEITEGEEVVTLEDGRKMPKSLYSQYQIDVGIIAAETDLLNKWYDENSNKVMELTEKVEANNYRNNLIQRNYNDWEKFYTTMGSGFMGIVNKAAYGSSKLQSSLIGYDNKILDNEFLKMQDAQNAYHQTFQKDVKFENAFNRKNFGRFIAQEFAQQAPIFATLAVPHIGIATLGLSSAGENWARTVRDDEFWGKDTSQFKKFMTSVGYGTAEVIFDRWLTLPVMRRSWKSMYGGSKNTMISGWEGVKLHFKQNGKRALLYDPLLEMSSEGLTTISQNLITGRPIGENLGHALFSGGMFGTMFGHVPFYKGVAMNYVSDYGSKKKYRDNLVTIADLKIKLDGTKQYVSPSTAKILNEELDALEKENQTILEDVDKKANSISKEWWGAYNNAVVTQENIRIKVEGIMNDKSLSTKEQLRIINRLQDEFSKAQGVRDVLRDEKTFGTKFNAFLNSVVKEDVDRRERILGQVTSQLIADGNTNPSDNQINEAARITYNTEEINKDFKNKRGKTKLGKSMENYQTVEEAIAAINKMENISDKAKAAAIKNIENGGHGANMQTIDGNFIPFQVVENMAKDDRLETRTHELGHTILSEAISMDSKAFDGIAEQILHHVRLRNPNLYTLLKVRAQGKSDEVITNFLELVAGGKMDLKSKSNKGLGALMGYLFGKGVQKATKSDVEFNFEGETDAIVFITQLAKKIKAGTLTMKERKAIKKSKIAKKAKAKVKQVKTGETKMSSPLEAINELIPGNVKTQGDYYALLDDPKVTNRILDAKGNLAPVIEAYIRSRSTSSEMAQKNIEAVRDRLINFDPAKERADGTIVGPEGFGEFIFANANFGKMVAAKKLAIEAKKKKRTTRIDDPDVKDIPDDTPTPTTEIEDKTKPRNLKDFDVELQDGLINEEIVEQVETLLKENPDDIEVQMEKLILNDIRKKLNDVIPKIAKDKKTGKRGPTPEYEAWIRGQYTEVVQSLGIETIRSAYKTWFQKKKIRTEKYKGISPKTGKVTNYVKDVFENTTNKREYIRWFLEGNERNLTERRTALIRRIARRKAKIATDNYIEVNSKNLGKVVEAKLRKASRAIEDTQIERKSFDAVKFSLTSLKQEFGLIHRKSKKVGTKWIGYTNPHTGLPQIFVDLGRMYEQAFANHFLKMKIKGFEVISKIASEVDGMADFVFKFNDVIENHELKASITAFMGSVSMSNFGFKNGKIQLATDIHNNLLEDVDIVEFKKGYKARIDYLNKRIKELNKTRPSDKQYDLLTYDITSGKPQYAPNEIFNEKDFGTKMFYQLKSDERVIQNHYGGKDVHSLSFVGKNGNMSVRLSGKSILNLPMLSANTDINFTFRNPGSKMINGDKMRAISLGIQFKISKLKNDPNTTPDITIKDQFEKALGVNFSKSIKGKKLNNAVKMSRSTNKPSKGITVLDFDDTLATTKSLVKFTTPEGKTGTLNAEEYASTYEDLLDKGYTFDFSDFNKVVKGKLAPLFNKAIKLQGKFGPENMFVLTARPAAAQKAIFDFLKANGLNIPLKNITGLGNSTAEAKALWVADKVGEGYNDFYFADDALQNVQAVKNMLDQFDVKSKVQQAKVKFSKGMNDQFNDILENVTGIEAKKRFSAIKARKRGEKKGRFRFFIPPSHEDFVGLLYNFIGKGKEGNKHRDFFEQALVRPLNRAFRELNAARQSIANDYRSLNKQFKNVKKKLNKKTPDGDFTYQDAIRVYLWDKHGYDIPGLTSTDQQNLVDIVMSDKELQTYAETLDIISKRENYVKPSEGWEVTDIRMDLDDATGRIGRKEFFTDFLENAEIIFSQENLNKIEAAYGSDMVSAIKDMLYRIETGRNRPSGQNKIVNGFMNWFNASVASTMFINVRSVVLQQMSLVNFINYSDNNILAAAKAFANQKQYWLDWATLFNSDFMKQRRGGIKTDVNGAELAESLKGAKNNPVVLLGKLLQFGFKPTQIGDNVAIATGGAAYYRNRINTYLKQGLSQKEAEAKAFVDFQVLAEATQQSARPDMVSQQQASPLGKVILAFQNVTSQFNRLGKKAFLDIKNRRISPEYKNASNPQLQSDISNLSRIAYYFAIQNLIFYSLQSALFMAMFDDDEDDKQLLRKKERVIQGSIDSVLRGTGVWGAVVATLKNMAIKRFENEGKDWRANEYSVLAEALQVSPPLGSRARKLVKAERELIWDKKVIDEMETFDIENPLWPAITNYIEGTTNAPANRTYNLTLQAKDGLDNQFTALQRVLRLGGWGRWDLGIEDVKKEKKKQKFSTKKTQLKTIKLEKIKIK